MPRRRTILLAALALVALVFFVARRSSGPELDAASSSTRAAVERAERTTPELAVQSDLDSSATSRQVAEPSADIAIEHSAARVATLIGRVVDRDGRGILGAKLRRGTDEELALALLDPSAVIGSSRDQTGTSTDYEGGFAFTDVSTTDGTLIVGPWHDGLVAERGWTLVKPGEHPVLVMQVCAHAKLFAEAYNASTDEPISRLHVDVLMRGPREVSAAGVEGFDGWNGKLEPELVFAPGASIELRFSVPSMAVANTAELTRTVQPTDGEEIRLRIPVDVDHAISPPGKSVITGIVLDARTREPIPHATVSIAPVSVALPENAESGSPRPDTVTVFGGTSVSIPSAVSRSDARGRFRLVAPQNSDLVLTVRAPDHCATEVRVRANDDVEVLMRRATLLALRVADVDGKPVSGAFVTIIRSQDGVATLGNTGMTDEAGERTLDELGPGTWTMSLGRPSDEAKGIVSLPVRAPADALTIPIQIDDDGEADLRVDVIVDTSTWTGTWKLKASRE
ncbi:MAG: carboxypeptidase-like regulatory domain-containing protein [Planctomycetes bacterium]|nr:carboxypeptidase-like regulatory domain-containing protein [Planctomycetota bacterium]